MFSEDGSSIFVLFLADAFRQGTVCFLMLGALPTHVGNIDVQASSSALKLCIRFYDAAQQRFVFHDRRFRRRIGRRMLPLVAGTCQMDKASTTR
jgi:hypothetical protein